MPAVDSWCPDFFLLSRTAARPGVTPSPGFSCAAAAPWVAPLIAPSDFSCAPAPAAPLGPCAAATLTPASSAAVVNRILRVVVLLILKLLGWWFGGTFGATLEACAAKTSAVRTSAVKRTGVVNVPTAALS